jgi:cysteine desulfurase/selenocysteine lyase
MDIEAIRKDFPITNTYTNLDNAGLSPFPIPVKEAVEKLVHDRTVHGVKAFWDWVDTVDETRELIAALINATPEEIAFTQNTSEGINIAANVIDWSPGDNVVLNDLEFAPNYWPWLRLRRFGVEIRMINHKNGRITTQDFVELVDDKTKVIALSSVAWINGLKHDLSEIGALAKKHNAYLVVDAIQSVGNSCIDVREGPIDFLACGGHKWLFGLLGSGFLFCRKELIEQCEPVYLGWQSDEDRFDYTFREYQLAPTAQRFQHGNNSIAGIFSLNAGIKYINRIGIKNIESRNRYLTDYLIEQLQPLFIDYLSPLEEKYRSSFINFIPSDSEGVFNLARERDILICVREGGIRASPNFYNTEEEIDQLVEVVNEVEIVKA